MKKEFRGLMTDNLTEANILVCGIPFDKNASVGKGASLAPKVLRELSYDLPPANMLGNPISKTKIYDLGDYDLNDFNDLTYKLYVDLESKTDKFHIVLGGDHSVAIASEAAFYKKAIEENKEPVIIHIDAHPDICDSYKGNKYSHACPIKRALDLGYKDENITLIGIRGFELEEIETFKKHPKIDVYKAQDVKTLGIEPLLLILYSKYRDSKYKIYISPQAQINLDNENPISLTDIRLIRRIVRDSKYRNSSAEDTLSMWPSVRRGEFKWIYQTQEEADYVFDSFLNYELCVLKKYAYPLINKIDKDGPFGPDAERLLKLLKYFVDLDEKYIPCNSILKEFIGGSCYRDAGF